MDYDRIAGRAIDANERLGARTIRRLASLLDDARKEVARIITNAEDAEWTQARYRILLKRISGAGEDMGIDLRRMMSEEQRARYDDAAQLTDDMLAKFGGEAERLHVPIDRRKLKMLTEFSTDLVQDVPAKVIADVSKAVRVGIVAEQSPWDVIKRIGRSLVDNNGSPLANIWGDTLTRAEVIYRTEIPRAHSVATDQRMAEHERIRPGLQKIWLHSRKRKGRESHMDAERRYSVGGEDGPIAVAEDFRLYVDEDEEQKGMPAGTYRARYPRDYRLPAGLAVNCGCVSVPYRAEWEA